MGQTILQESTVREPDCFDCEFFHNSQCDINDNPCFFKPISIKDCFADSKPKED